MKVSEREPSKAIGRIRLGHCHVRDDVDGAAAMVSTPEAGGIFSVICFCLRLDYVQPFCLVRNLCAILFLFLFLCLKRRFLKIAVGD